MSLAGVFAAADVLVFVMVNIVIVICRLLLNKGIVIILYSPTKYSAVFLKEKIYFKIRAKGHVVAKGRAEGHVAAGVLEGGHVAAGVPEGGCIVAGVPEVGPVAPDNQHG